MNGKKALLLPSRDLLSGGGAASSKEWEHKRLYTLSALADGAFSVCVGSVEAFCEVTAPPENIKNNIFSLKEGQQIAIKDLLDRLVSAGYTFSEQCEGVGQFSHRGGIVDIFPVTLLSPVRIEFWGDEIDVISVFDPDTQRRGENIPQVDIAPAREALYEKNDLAGKIKALLSSRKKLTDAQVERLYEIRRQFGLKGKHPADICPNAQAGKPSCHGCGGSCGGHGADADTVAKITKLVLEQLGK